MKLTVRYPRPKRLSDPCFDFTPRVLEELLAKRDEQLDWRDYQALFGPHLPAGTYEEVVYFLPTAFDYLLTHPDESLDLVSPIIGFVSKNSTQLESDGLLEPVRQKLRECFQTWTNEFIILHFDQEACAAKEWTLEYFDYVQLTETVCEGTTELVRFETQSDLALEFVRNLADHSNDFVRAAWFLEYSRCRFDVYTAPAFGPVQELIADPERLWKAVQVVTESPRFTDAPTYWRDTFQRLGI
jgi:hypothetical protein